MDPIFESVDAGSITAVVSPVTLAECLVGAYRQEQAEQIHAFGRVLTSGPHTVFVPIDWSVAERAANLRARYNLSLADALQVAVALAAGCDAFLTNDAAFKRVSELAVIMLGDMET